jgi:NitT/TauT family transport system permease protein
MSDRLFRGSTFRQQGPDSVPTMISTLKVNVGLALVGIIVGEFQAAKAGLGYLITYEAIVVMAAISWVLFIAVLVLRRSGRIRSSN